MSDTPRTDEAEKKSDSKTLPNFFKTSDYSHLFGANGWDFARDLERENQALYKRLEAVERENKRLVMCVLSGSSNDE